MGGNFRSDVPGAGETAAAALSTRDGGDKGDKLSFFRFLPSSSSPIRQMSPQSVRIAYFLDRNSVRNDRDVLITFADTCVPPIPCAGLILSLQAGRELP